MPRHLLLSISAVLALLVSGCIASMTVIGVTDAVDDDDATGDDDDTTAADDDDDDDDVPLVDCGPVVYPDGDGSGLIFSGASEMAEQADGGWDYDGCEVMRVFEDGELVCESEWRVTGPMVHWNDGIQAGAFRLDFVPTGNDTACGDEEEETWRYRIRFDWEAAEAGVDWAPPGGGAPEWEFWADGELPVLADGYMELVYVTEFFEDR